MSSSSSGSGIGIAGATFLIFLTLKLLNHIDWSWFWVTSPLWIAFAFYAVIFAAFIVVFAR